MYNVYFHELWTLFSLMSVHMNSEIYDEFLYFTNITFF